MDEILESVFFFQAEDGIRDLTVTGVQTCALPIFMAKEDRLTGTGEFPRVGDDASCGGRCRLSVLRRGWAGYEESDSDAGRGPTTPLRHPSRSMANVWFVGGTACGRPDVTPAAHRAQT